MNEILKFILFGIVLIANLVGVFIKFRPIHWKYFYLTHHVLYFLVMAAAAASVLSAYAEGSGSLYFSAGVILTMLPLPFFKKGKFIHIILGSSAFIFSFAGLCFS